MKLVYGVKDKPKFAQLIILAFQQLLSIITATLVVPVIINGACGTNMSSAAALFDFGRTCRRLLLCRQKRQTSGKTQTLGRKSAGLARTESRCSTVWNRFKDTWNVPKRNTPTGEAQRARKAQDPSGIPCGTWSAPLMQKRRTLCKR